MFDPAGSTGHQLAARLVANHTELVERECEVLVLAAGWADVHGMDPTAEGYDTLVERARRFGGEGTPEVSEYAGHELGALQGLPSGSADQLMADALDLRHRLPRLWARVRTAQVRAWQARRVAQATSHLPFEAAGLVDRAVSGFLGQLPWARCQRILTAAVLQADPDLAEQREELAARSRDVMAYDGDDGLKTLVAKAAAGDVVWFMATVNRLADILKIDGDADPVGTRRAKAIGLLAQPAVALQLLIDHAQDADPHPSMPGRHEPPAGGEEPGEEHTSLNLTPPAELARPVGAGVLRPRVVLHFHLSDAALLAGHGLVRPEHGDAQTLAQLQTWLAETGCVVQVRPIRDASQTRPVDAYETPLWLRDLLLSRNPVDVFPFGVATSRGMDADHTIPFLATAEGGPPGQTGLHNLGPHNRSHHRAVTHSRWRRRQPQPGTYLFRSPHRYVFIVTNQGTLDLGDGPFAQQVWHQAVRERGPHRSAAWRGPEPAVTTLLTSGSVGP